MKERIKKLLDLVTAAKADTAVVTKKENVRYLSGFSGDSATLVINKKAALLVTDSRYLEQAAAEAKDFSVVEQKDGLLKKTAESAKKISAKIAAFEGNAIIYDDYRILSAALKPLKTAPTKFDPLREIKDEEEIALIKAACKIADDAFADVLHFIRPGLSEKEVACHLEDFMRKNGSERPAFSTIVASGKRGSLPHGEASDKIIEVGDFVTMDFGAVYKGYSSDMTRTICVGKADDRQKEIYAAVLKAQLTGLAALKKNASGVEVDKAARDTLGELGKYFGHSLGHSVGLEIHENPRLSPKSKCAHLPVGAVITVEPGVYIPGWGGIRIEDTALVTEGASERLTLSPKELIEV